MVEPKKINLGLYVFWALYFVRIVQSWIRFCLSKNYDQNSFMPIPKISDRCYFQTSDWRSHLRFTVKAFCNFWKTIFIHKEHAQGRTVSIVSKRVSFANGYIFYSIQKRYIKQIYNYAFPTSKLNFTYFLCSRPNVSETTVSLFKLQERFSFRNIAQRAK